MHKTHNYLASTSLGLAALVTLACHDSTAPTELKTGAIEISVATVSESADLDPGEFTFSIDGGPAQPIGSNARQTIAALLVGSHLIRLNGLAPNCSISDPNPRWVYVTDTQPASVSFAVSCTTKSGDSGAGDWDY